MRVKCLAQEHNTMTRPRLEPGPLDPESSALTTMPPRLPLKQHKLTLIASGNVVYYKYLSHKQSPIKGATSHFIFSRFLVVEN